ncbi:MAG: hypothetical protein C0176_03365 [Mesoaciditoga sp.]|uniref:hypothetical protein n=1 Tax=Athalassotoga sp. TaxID=2022597 RepID=UPI000CAD0840|nr:MAG: hypothetical protein C0185_00370 [Mesoaciditoga sp.]PMP80050.1 MAG: hypothetical protein C0176_03365 [Mesoaciditoga sp.]HEU24026.1 hypothetical protein [Mesoaciditoga lauensis]
MNYLNFLEAVIIMIAVTLPLLIGKNKKNEENLFWASMVSVVLAIIATFVTGNANIGVLNFSNFWAILIPFIAGFITYGIYGLNFEIQYSKISPITWLIFIPIIDTLIFRHIGILYTSEMNFKIQVLAWFFPVNVFLISIIASLIYFFIYLRNGVKEAIVDAAVFFVFGMIAGYIYVNYGILTAFVSELVFNLWRIIFGSIKFQR